MNKLTIAAQEQTSPSLMEVAPRAVSRKVAAAMLGVSTKSIERLIARGELPGFRIGWGWRVLISDLEAFIARQQASERRRIGKKTDEIPAS